MNKDLIIKNIKPYLNVRKELLYSDFEKIFSFLERKEQYQVSELLFSIGVELVDDKDSDEAAPESKKTQEEPHKSIIVTVKDSTSRSVKKSLNKIRKTYGTILLDNGVEESLVIAQMGHTDIKTTKRYYYRNRKSLQQKSEVIDKVSGL